MTFAAAVATMFLMSRLSRLLKRILDRPGGRPILDWLIAVRRDLPTFPVSVRIWTRRRVWPPVRLNRLLHSPAAQDEMARDLFFQEYTPKSGDTVIEVGAGAGEETPLLSRCVGPTGRVYSIEAHPETFEALVRCCAQLANVMPVNVAISNRVGLVHITTKDTYIFNQISDRPVGLGVSAVTLDEFIASRGLVDVDFLKMNIEGAEIRALQGMEQSVPFVKHLAVGCHDFLSDRGGDHYLTKHDVRRLLLQYGYEVRGRWIGDRRPYARDYLYARRH